MLHKLGRGKSFKSDPVQVEKALLQLTTVLTKHCLAVDVQTASDERFGMLR